MIGAEILALVALLLGAGVGIKSIHTWATVYKEHANHKLQQEELMRHAMHEALQQHGHEPIDIFLVEWGHMLSKDEKRRLEDIRTNRFILDDEKKR